VKFEEFWTFARPVGSNPLAAERDPAGHIVASSAAFKGDITRSSRGCTAAPASCSAARGQLPEDDKGNDPLAAQSQLLAQTAPFQG
jgi:hypothetical protein